MRVRQKSEHTDWEQDGFFVDANGVLVKCYDHVVLLTDVEVREQGHGGPFEIVPAGSTAVPLFYTKSEPVILDVECLLGEGAFCFAETKASDVQLLATGEELRGVESLPEQKR